MYYALLLGFSAVVKSKFANPGGGVPEVGANYPIPEFGAILEMASFLENDDIVEFYLRTERILIPV